MIKLLTGLDGFRGQLARLLAILLVCAGLLPLTAMPGFAQGETAAQSQLVAQQTALERAIHGTRSARGMIVNDQIALQSIKLKPVKLADGQYMLRAYDTNTGQFVKVSHPTLKAQLRGVMETRFTSAESAATSAPAYKGHLTRTANSLESSYRGRLGGLQTQLNKVTGEIGTPVPEPAVQPQAKPVVETSTAKPANVAEVNGPKPVTESGTVVNEPVTTVKEPVTTVKEPAATVNEPASTTAKAPGEGVGTGTKTSASETAAPTPVVEPVVPTTRMGQLKAATKGAFKDSVKMIPLMLATGVGVDLYRQYKETGTLSIGQSIKNVMSTEFLMAMGGAVGGGTVGSVAGTMLSSFAGPAAPFVKAAMTIGGAAFGASFMSGQEIDWKRLAFTTALTAGVTLLVPGGFLGLAAVTATGFGGDWLYDKLFGKKKDKPAVQAAKPWKAPTPIPVPLAGGNPNPPTPVPTTVAQPPQQPPVQVQPPVTPPKGMYPPLPPDKDPYADLRYTSK